MKTAKTMGMMTFLSVLALLLVGIGPAEAIRLRPVGEPAGELVVEIKVDKALYRIGEAIRFVAAGNKDHYLYVFGIDEAANKGYVLLPNSMETGNFHQAGQRYPVPGKGVDFVGDKAGVERIIFVASTRKIDLETGRFAKAGPFLSTDAETVRRQVKAIRVRATPKAEMSAGEIAITVLGR